jgi:hypothetical protein
MKRFTETSKWADPWFRKLLPKTKLLWQWLCDNCDPSGAIDFDPEMASFFVGEEFQKEDLGLLGDRLLFLPNGKVWIVNFIPFQYGELSTECRPHKVVFDAIRKNNLQYPIRYPINGVSDTPQEKEKDKDKDKDVERGAGERPKKDNLPTSDRAKRVADLFKRRHTTPWDDKEITAFKKLSKHPDEDFDLVVEFYHSDYEFLRHDLQTFLNNFTGEIDKARKWKAGKLNGNHRHPTSQNPRVSGTANEGMCDQYAGIGRLTGTSPVDGEKGP